MDDSLHPKFFERGRFKVVKFPNRTLRLIHQMWNQIVTMIVIKKDNIMVTIFEVMQIDVEGSLMIRAPKKQKEETMEEKREKMIDTLVMKKYLKGLDKTKCKHVDESIKSEFPYCFPFGNKPIEGIKVPINKFLPPPKRIMYHPLSDTHKNEIKHRILMFHYIDKQFPIFVILVDSNDPTKILKTKPMN
jgi:hypothetical protein